MNEHRPHVPAETNLADFTIKAVIAGAFLGIVFGSANAYLGLRVGLTISTSIPLAVVSVALFRALAPVIGPSSILDCNMAQTTGSASSSLASGVIFTIPALFMWGFDPSLLKIATLAALGATLGILFMIPLRRYLIVGEHGKLPYPEGVASAQVLIAADTGGTRARNVFLGLGVGALAKFLISFGHLWAEKVSIKIPLLKKGILGIEPTAALLGVGYILGYRIGGIMVAGGIIASLGLIPLIAHFGEGLTSPMFPETTKAIADMSASEIWSRYIRYIGAGAVAFAGILTAARAIPMMVRALTGGLKGFKGVLGEAQGDSASGSTVIRTDRDLPMTVLAVGALGVLVVIVASPVTLGAGGPIIIRVLGAICIGIFAFLFVTVSSRIVGMVGVTSNPTSGMAIVTLLATSILFYSLGWTDSLGQATVLTIGTVVCVAASIAGDISQDLKTGFIVGATPARQQTAELIGAWTSALAIAASVWLLGEAFTFGSEDLPAPQATLMKTVIEGVLQANLPWGLVITGAALAMAATLLGIPALPFAVGVYLPVSAMTPVFLGGCLRALVEWRAGKVGQDKGDRAEQGVLLGSGFIAGEGLMGVGVALYAFVTGGKPAGFGLHWPQPWGQVVAMVVFAGLGYLIFSSTEKAAKNYPSSG
ncbi:MAG: oligopeptide transporter, OPT family [Proteobacteria bacterium]|nr:oligopeptide transporter, OPT family [Pseudomonadota bacterium]